MSNPLLKLCIIVVASLLVILEHIPFSRVIGITNESCLIERNSALTTNEMDNVNSAGWALDGNINTHWAPTSKSAWLEIQRRSDRR